MKLVTWNVNSVRVRHARLLAFVQRQEPDVLCLQELKCVDEQFPRDALRSKGYSTALFGQKTYNGVAVISRGEIQSIRRSFEDGVEDPQARFIVVETMGVRVASAYIPNGSEVGSDKWKYKLEWLARLRRWLTANVKADESFALCGDFNIAPDDTDVKNPKDWADGTLCHEHVRAEYRALLSQGYEDLVRRFHPEGGPLTWWDYRRGAFSKDDGLRIDHVLATAPLARRAISASVDREERKGEGASDHAPVIVTFE
jgi:exodeoxyribonuclease-3